MATASLSATTRSGTGKGVARTLRAKGHVPGVIYGHAREAAAIAVPARELGRMLEKIEASSTVIELSIDGKTSRTLIREIQRHPVKKDILHIDFQELVAGEKVTVRLPIILVGSPDGVRNGGGILDQTMREIEVRVDPASIPGHIDVDVAKLGIGHSIHVRDLALPAGVEVLSDEDATICVIVAPKTHEETPAEAAAAEPEVLKKGKKDEDDAK
ncbi:MAG: 50S ribosomal protein L25/general stress protein Ctc [Gemmatimonadaceae bacterium]|nr:50S ribosomal protein L25/general stress protein Ctc [Gemmatimonadaceae bacterium]